MLTGGAGGAAAIGRSKMVTGQAAHGCHDREGALGSTGWAVRLEAAGKGWGSGLGWACWAGLPGLGARAVGRTSAALQATTRSGVRGHRADACHYSDACAWARPRVPWRATSTCVTVAACAAALALLQPMGCTRSRQQPAFQGSRCAWWFLLHGLISGAGRVQTDRCRPPSVRARFVARRRLLRPRHLIALWRAFAWRRRERQQRARADCSRSHCEVPALLR